MDRVEGLQAVQRILLLLQEMQPTFPACSVCSLVSTCYVVRWAEMIITYLGRRTKFDKVQEEEMGRAYSSCRKD